MSTHPTLPAEDLDVAVTLTIGEVARQAGLAGSTLRYYERRGLISPAGRDAHGRTYHPEVLDRLRIIDYFQQAGYTLAEIGQIFERGTDWQTRARQKRDELGARIAALQQAQELLDAALACGCDDVEGCNADLDVRAHRHELTKRGSSDVSAEGPRQPADGPGPRG